MAQIICLLTASYCVEVSFENPFLLFHFSSSISDLFGSESILDSSAVIKDVWPALSQKSVSTPCDLVSHSDQEADTLPNGQKQDEVLGSDSDILECANDDIQVNAK